VLFGVGSSIVVDVEESLSRAAQRIAVGVRNDGSESQLCDEVKQIGIEALDDEIINLPFLVPIFGPGNRQKAATHARSLGFLRPFCLIDPSVILPRRFDVGEGSYINAGCTLGSCGVLESFVFINRGASIGHHAHVESFVSIGPGVVIAGQVKIGRGAFIGVGATILPKITIGENAVVSAGSVVTRDVAPQTLVAGNPARVIREGIAGYQNMRVA
jgi:sugar O-acyltransferase (sialic acid O-acetyltransferase NeuD family)